VHQWVKKTLTIPIFGTNRGYFIQNTRATTYVDF